MTDINMKHSVNNLRKKQLTLLADKLRDVDALDREAIVRAMKVLHLALAAGPEVRGATE